MLSNFAQHLLRALHLLAVSIAPLALSPEPAPPGNLAFAAAIAALFLGAILYGAERLRSLLGTFEARIAAALAWVAVAAALAAALVYRGEGAPLARGVPLVAVPAWAALAAGAAALSARFLGPRWNHRRGWVIAVVLGAAALEFAYAAPLLASRERMWQDALRRDPGHEAALEALTRPLLRDHRYDDARRITDECLTQQRGACGCLDARAKIAIARITDHCLAAAPNPCACTTGKAEAERRRELLDEAVADGRAATTSCPDRTLSRAVYAEALALRGENAAAEREAATAINLGGHEARTRYALALALQGQGRYDDASAELRRAIQTGAGRDAQLLAAALALLKKDLDEAERWLSPLAAADPKDAVVAYDLALVADHRGRYNGARQGYLSALALDPCNASARLNLAYLTWKAGIQDEARHHARKFAELAAPDDRRVEELGLLVGIKLR